MTLPSEDRSNSRRRTSGAAKRPGVTSTRRQPSRHVGEIQRLRILTAMAEVAAARGAGAVTVAHIVSRAGVSRRTFYELFENCEQCFVVALEEAVERVAATAIPAYESESAWLERVRAGLAALLSLFDAEPALARLCVVEALAAGPLALAYRGRVVERLIQALNEGRAERRGEDPLFELTAEGVVGAVLSVIHARLLEKGREPLVELFGPLMSMIVLSYRGQAAARRELERPPPSLADARPSDGRRIDPLGDLGMRITYRTVRVLRVIAAHPQANNREIAMRAEVADQGQVSKLLARLQRLGLIHNEANSGKGAPNAWSLTTRGRQVEQAIRVEAPARGAGGSPAAGRSG